MVRKRTRTSRKYNEDNDSDSDFALEDPPSEPAQKKYSLRQRKRRIFTEFEFNDDGDEIEPTKVPSDDDDFEVDRELALDETSTTENIDKETSIDHYESEKEEIPEDPDGLIDFEDMIRADIVVNKNRIDYDNIIQKTEIKVQPIQEQARPVKSKRGRKPKARPENEIDSSLLEPETEMHEAEFEDKNDKDYIPEDDVDDEPIDCAKLMEAELSESANEIPIIPSVFTNEINNEVNMESRPVQENETTNTTQEDNIKSDNIPEAPNVTDNPLENSNVDNLPNTNRKILDVNGQALPPACPNNFIKSDEAPPKTTKIENLDAEDDDVVLVEDEKKCEVIVLDD